MSRVGSNGCIPNNIILGSIVNTLGATDDRLSTCDHNGIRSGWLHSANNDSGVLWTELLFDDHGERAESPDDSDGAMWNYTRGC